MHPAILSRPGALEQPRKGPFQSGDSDRIRTVDIQSRAGRPDLRRAGQDNAETADTLSGFLNLDERLPVT